MTQGICSTLLEISNSIMWPPTLREMAAGHLAFLMESLFNVEHLGQEKAAEVWGRVRPLPGAGVWHMRGGAQNPGHVGHLPAYLPGPTHPPPLAISMFQALRPCLPATQAAASTTAAFAVHMMGGGTEAGGRRGATSSRVSASAALLSQSAAVAAAVSAHTTKRGEKEPAAAKLLYPGLRPVLATMVSLINTGKRVHAWHWPGCPSFLGARAEAAACAWSRGSAPLNKEIKQPQTSTLPGVSFQALGACAVAGSCLNPASFMSPATLPSTDGKPPPCCCVCRAPFDGAARGTRHLAPGLQSANRHGPAGAPAERGQERRSRAGSPGCAGWPAQACGRQVSGEYERGSGG